MSGTKKTDLVMLRGRKKTDLVMLRGMKEDRPSHVEGERRQTQLW